METVYVHLTPVPPIVGRTFVARHGMRVKIVKEVNGWFYSDEGEAYTFDGKGYHGSHFDLIAIA